MRLQPVNSTVIHASSNKCVDELQTCRGIYCLRKLKDTLSCNSLPRSWAFWLQSPTLLSAERTAISTDVRCPRSAVDEDASAPAVLSAPATCWSCINTNDVTSWHAVWVYRQHYIILFQTFIYLFIYFRYASPERLSEERSWFHRYHTCGISSLLPFFIPSTSSCSLSSWFTTSWIWTGFRGNGVCLF